MADVNVAPEVSPEFANTLGQAIAAAIDSARPKKVTFGEYAKREAKRNPRPKLLHQCYQNGYRVPEDNLTAKEIIALNKMTHGARYFDRKLELIVREEGLDKIIEIRYPNKTADQRFEMRQYFRNFEDLVGQIAESQVADDEEAATAPAPKRTVGGKA